MDIGEVMCFGECCEVCKPGDSQTCTPGDKNICLLKKMALKIKKQKQENPTTTQNMLAIPSSTMEEGGSRRKKTFE